MFNRIRWSSFDFVYKVIKRMRRTINPRPYFTQGNVGSDSEITQYEGKISQMLNKEKSIKKFRRKRFYREILEHVDYKLGLEYISRIEDMVSPNHAFILINQNRLNDHFGSPITFSYGKYGRISPTTLRYIATALELSSNFGIDAKTSIVELGCGYGGQAAILNRIFGTTKYTPIDLQPVLKLTNYYLAKINSNLKIVNATNLESSQNWDLFVSNYAFSELNRNLQIFYLKNVLTKCKQGYMVMNSGLTNTTGRSTGKLSLSEIKQFLPTLVCDKEIPKTGPDNYVLRWG